MKKSLITIVGAACLTAVMGLSPVFAGDTLQVKGSDTLVHLSSSWAEKFMEKKPASEVAITGGGSGTGISALLNGTADLANASRKMKDLEKDKIKSQGFEPVEFIVAKDGIGVIVHPSNPINQLNMNQIKQIFTGQVNNWKKYGGPKAKILLYTRDSSSGTFAFFQKRVLKKKDYSVRARRLASNSAIVESVSKDVNAIGYVGLGYVAEAGDRVKALKVREGDGPAVSPTQETVKNDTYPISRGLQVYSKGQPKGLAKEFVDYMLSAEGQQIVNDRGFVAVQ